MTSSKAPEDHRAHADTRTSWVTVRRASSSPAGADGQNPLAGRLTATIDAPTGRRTRGSGARAAVAGLQLGGDGLDFGVGIEGLVAHLAAPAGLLVAAEGQGGVEHVVAVDPDRAGPELLGQRVGLGDVAGPDAGAQAVGGVVRLGRDL